MPQTFVFTVEGAGAFPFDMLRSDRCWPYYGEDASQLNADKRRRVVLESCAIHKPTRRRWESHGWRVVEIGYPDENSRRISTASS